MSYWGRGGYNNMARHHQAQAESVNRRRALFWCWFSSPEGDVRLTSSTRDSTQVRQRMRMRPEAALNV